ncbi:hypothetical protein Ciccas_000623 [Cichlidogyrus casuarinus]|uniref:Uncharacterized protein n=1 Tax=Cichlidogyrus casuarinus TaxID=1844966 RepID=A0ABD2QMD7_9PLAT
MLSTNSSKFEATTEFKCNTYLDLLNKILGSQNPALRLAASYLYQVFVKLSIRNPNDLKFILNNIVSVWSYEHDQIFAPLVKYSSFEKHPSTSEPQRSFDETDDLISKSLLDDYLKKGNSSNCSDTISPRGSRVSIFMNLGQYATIICPLRLIPLNSKVAALKLRIFKSLVKNERLRKASSLLTEPMNLDCLKASNAAQRNSRCPTNAGLAQPSFRKLVTNAVGACLEAIVNTSKADYETRLIASMNNPSNVGRAEKRTSGRMAINIQLVLALLHVDCSSNWLKTCSYYVGMREIFDCNTIASVGILLRSATLAEQLVHLVISAEQYLMLHGSSIELETISLDIDSLVGKFHDVNEMRTESNTSMEMVIFLSQLVSAIDSIMTPIAKEICQHEEVNSADDSERFAGLFLVPLLPILCQMIGHLNRLFETDDSLRNLSRMELNVICYQIYHLLVTLYY